MLLLLQHGAAVDRAAADGDTPLHDACEAGQGSLVRLLARHGANPRLPGAGARTPLQLLRARGDSTAVGAWLAAVVGFRALHWACESRDPAGVRAALRGDAVLDASARSGANGEGPTALELVSHPGAFPHEPSPVRKETAALVRAALAPWSPGTHRVQTAAFRRGVLAVLCVGVRLRGESERRRSRRRQERGAVAPLPLLPPDVWACVLSQCTRNWWVSIRS